MNVTRTFTKTDILFSFALGLPYSVILIFSAYGPALHYISGPEKNAELSSIFLAVLMISMILPAFPNLSLKKHSLFVSGMTLLSAVLIGGFTKLGPELRITALAVLGFTEGRIARLWAAFYIGRRDEKKRVFILVLALCSAYSLLYLSNLFFPLLQGLTVSILSAIVLLLTIPLILYLYYVGISNGVSLSGISRSVNIAPNRAGLAGVLGLIFIIYITAGFSYTVIFPSLRTTAEFYRFYNVLPFVLVLPPAGLMLKRFGAKTILHLGIMFLGISYLLYRIPGSGARYFLVESFIQPGWALLDLFVWYLGLYYSEKYGKSTMLTAFVSVFLFGTLSGAVISIFLMNTSAGSILFLLLSLLPLLLVIPMLNLFQSAERSRAGAGLDAVTAIPSEILTRREYEIAVLLAENRTQSEICSGINISINTLKTHTRNIYRKLDISSKKDLVNRYANQKAD